MFAACGTARAWTYVLRRVERAFHCTRRLLIPHCLQMQVMETVLRKITCIMITIQNHTSRK